MAKSVDYTWDNIVLQRMSALNRNESKALWVKPVPELKYVNAENVARYRLIMRTFYENHQRLKYWLRPQDVYEQVKTMGLLGEYTEEQCQSDLEQLREWKNLTAAHDGGRAMSIEEYLKRRFRYQMTPYAVEIERMLQSLENITGYGGSLEPRQMEKLAAFVLRARDAAGRFAPDEALNLWHDIQDAFRQLHESSSDYLASLSAAQAEELMLTEKFLEFKDLLSDRLRNFVLGLQRYGSQLEGLFRDTPNEVWSTFLDAVVNDEVRLPVLDSPVPTEERRARHETEWAVIGQWFVGTDRDISDVQQLERATKDAISRIVRYALAIQEKFRVGVSRKRELDVLGQWFFRLHDEGDADKAHELGALTFGLYGTRHLQGDGEASSDSANLSLWDEEPIYRALRSRSRARTRRSETQFVKSTRAQQEAAAAVILAEKAREAQLIEGWLALGSFAMSELPPLPAAQRPLLLSWLSRCLSNQSRKSRTPDGLEVELTPPATDARATLHFSDGDLDLPDFRMQVKAVRSS